VRSKITKTENVEKLPKFWDYLKSLKEGQNTSSNKYDIPVDKLYGHFQNLQKAAYNYLDNTILPTEIETRTKLLGSKKAPGPDKIRNEMIKAGI